MDIFSFFMPPTQRTNPNLHQGCQGRRPIGFHGHCVRIGSREQIRSPANKVSLSHHSVTLAVDGELYSAPLEDDKLKASHQSWPLPPLLAARLTRHRMGPCQTSVRNRGLHPGMDLPSRSLRLHPHPFPRRLRGRLGSALLVRL